MKRSFYLSAFLAIVACLAALLLTSVHNLTAPIIQKNEEEKVNTMLLQVFPQASSFNKQTLPDDADNSLVAWYRAEGHGDIFQVSVNGYSGNGSMVFIVGIDTNGNFAGFAMINNEDSAGFGQRLTAEYPPLVNGLDASRTPDTISGATKSSKAVQNGLKVVYEFWAAHKN